MNRNKDVRIGQLRLSVEAAALVGLPIRQPGRLQMEQAPAMTKGSRAQGVCRDRGNVDAAGNARFEKLQFSARSSLAGLSIRLPERLQIGKMPFAVKGNSAQAAELSGISLREKRNRV